MLLTDEEVISRMEAEGWKRLVTKVYSASIGMTWLKGEAGDRTVAVLTDERVANDHMGMIHGGAQMTFADLALGVAAVDVIGAPRCATVQLQYNFVSSGRVGGLLTCRPEVVRATRQLIFARGLLQVDGKTIGSAEGITKIFPPGEG